MRFDRWMAVSASALVMSVSVPAFAANCSFGDIASNVTGCVGFFEGNLISGNKGDKAVAAEALQELGLNGADGTWLEKIDISSRGTIDFATPLTGQTIVGIHFGKALGANPAGVDLKGGGTAFYVFEAGTSLDSFSVKLGGLSNAALYSTVSAVPEPPIYALMFAGLATIGFMVRRRRQG